MDMSRIFLTDHEFEGLFGEELSRVLRILKENAKDKCSPCKGECCRVIACELYSEKFSSCPIYDIRPRECRFHFCREILDTAPLSKEDRELFEKPTRDLLKNDEEGKQSELFPMFPQFPLDPEGLASLGIDEASRVTKAFEEGELDEDQAVYLLRNLCRCKGK